MSAIDRLQSVSGGIAVKAPCRVATTANKTLSGLSAVDGVTPAAGDRILVWEQTDTTQNGIYDADSGTWTRAIDFDGVGDCAKGTIVYVAEGTLYGKTIFAQTTSSPVPGTSAITFEVSGAAALALASSYMRSTIFPLTTAAGVLAALGFGPDDNNDFTGNNTFEGDDTHTGTDDFTGSDVTVADLTDLDYTRKPLNSRFFFDYLPPSVRQTVYGGPVTSAGLPDFLPASVSSSLVLPTQNTGAGYPLIVTAAGGVSANNRDRDLTAAIGSTSWTLADNSTLYLYVTVTAAGAFTRGSTTLPPIYQWGGTPSTTSGQFTFNISEMRGYMGNGATAPQAYIVFVGEAVTVSGDITSTRCYAYNGRFESAWTATLPAADTAVSANHNLGVPPRLIDFVAENTSTEAGYAAGDQIMRGSFNTENDAANLFLVPAMFSNFHAVGMIPGKGVWTVLNKSSGVEATLTTNKWRYRFMASRGW